MRRGRVSGLGRDKMFRGQGNCLGKGVALGFEAQETGKKGWVETV